VALSSRDFGRYTLIKKLATGGMAEVYLARQQGMEGFEKLLVIKRILPHLADDNDFVQMFLNEARIAARFNHPNIVQIYDLGKIDETYFIAMEFVHGEDMGRVMRKCWTKGHWIPQPLALLIVARVCEALYYAHTKADEHGQPLKVIHRDISPQNILVSFDGAVKLVDFGIARAADSASNTRSGALKGKFAYMAPEQAQNKPIDHRADLFATGLVLYEFLTGVRPLKRDSDIATLQAVMECSIRPPSEVAHEVPPSLDAVTMKALSRVADDRYADGRAFQMAIEEFLIREQWAASSVHLSEFMKTLFSDRLQQEAKLGRPDPDAVESGSASLQPRLPDVPPPDPAQAFLAPVIERPSAPTMRVQGPTGPPSLSDANWDAPPAVAAVSRKQSASSVPAVAMALGGTSMNPVPIEEEPTEMPPPPKALPRRPTKSPPRHSEPTPVSGTGKGVVDPTRVARKTGEQPSDAAPAGDFAAAPTDPKKNSNEEWDAPPGVSPEKKPSPAPVAAAATALNPVPEALEEEPTESIAGETAALRPLKPALVPGPPKTASLPGNKLPRSATPAPGGSATAAPKRTPSGQSLARTRLATPAPRRSVPVAAVKPVEIDDEPSVSLVAAEADDQPSVSLASELSSVSRTGWHPDKRAIAFAVTLATIGVGVLAFSPQLAGWLQPGKTPLMSNDPALLTVQSDPPGLDLFVNEQLLGKTPVVRAHIVSNETLTIKIESDPRGIRWAMTVHASPGQEVKFSPSFSVGKVIVRLADRRAARIYIGNQLVGLCDGLDYRCAQIEHPAGNYRLRLEDDSSGELMRGEVEVRIQSGRTTETQPVKLHVVK
jgi:eukaryotic-like serine/threonine-protein kinase